MKAVPVFCIIVLCFKHLPGKELVQTGTECRAFDRVVHTRYQCPGLLGYAAKNWSSPSPLCQKEFKVQQETKPAGVCNWWLVWRGESWVLVCSSTAKICTGNSLNRIWEENLYYVYKWYFVFFRIRIFLRSVISLN